MDEYIDRQAAIEAIDESLKRVFVLPVGKSIIDKIPAADVVERKIGKWEEVEVTWLVDIEDQPDAIASMFCPQCKRYANHVYYYGSPTYGMNFCPNCGADMREKS